MLVSATTEGETVRGANGAPPPPQKAEFSRILNKQTAGLVRHDRASVFTQGSQTGNKAPLEAGRFLLSTVYKYNPPVLNNGFQAGRQDLHATELVQIGTISESDPTVSHLMVKNPVYGKDCWNILHSSINHDKAYGAIPKGSRIYLNPETREIVWNRQGVSGDGAQTENKTSKNAEPVFLGTLSKNDSTVSELLIKHPVYGKDCWGILSSGINRDKAYTSIPGGSSIYLNPKTLEVVWNKNRRPVEHAVETAPPRFAGRTDTVEGIQPFFRRAGESRQTIHGKALQRNGLF